MPHKHFDFLDQPIGKALFFRWHEALYLPRWKIYAIPDNDTICENIIKTAEKMDLIRSIFNKPIKVTSWLRPGSYNQLIGGAKQSAHVEGLACDFIIIGCDSQTVRATLKDRLQELGIRMESIPTPHVHIDLRCSDDMTNERRFFKP